jgi:WD40 repeat protein
MSWPGRRTGARYALAGRRHGPVGRSVAAAAGHIALSEICVWDLKSGKEIRRWHEQRPYNEEPPDFSMTGPIWMAFAPDSKAVAVPGFSADRRYATHVVDLASGKELRQFKDRGTVAFAPDGKTVAVIACNNKAGLTLWEMSTGKERAPLPLDWAGPDVACAFSADGKTLAVASAWFGEARLFDLATRKELRRFQPAQNQQGTSGQGQSVPRRPNRDRRQRRPQLGQPLGHGHGKEARNS